MVGCQVPADAHHRSRLPALQRGQRERRRQRRPQADRGWRLKSLFLSALPTKQTPRLTVALLQAVPTPSSARFTSDPSGTRASTATSTREQTAHLSCRSTSPSDSFVSPGGTSPRSAPCVRPFLEQGGLTPATGPSVNLENQWSVRSLPLTEPYDALAHPCRQRPRARATNGRRQSVLKVSASPDALPDLFQPSRSSASTTRTSRKTSRKSQT